MVIFSYHIDYSENIFVVQYDGINFDLRVNRFEINLKQILILVLIN